MTALTDKRLATTAWELATSIDAVTFERFARIACTKVTEEAGKRAFYRFAEWAAANGVDVRMEGNVASYDRAKLKALANRIRTRLSPASVTKSNQEARTMSKSNEQSRTGEKADRPYTPRDERLTIRQAARMIGLEEAVLARRLRCDPPLIPFLRIGRSKRLRLVDVVAWIEANTIGARKS